jgi:hypothetical protein
VKPLKSEVPYPDWPIFCVPDDVSNNLSSNLKDEAVAETIVTPNTSDNEDEPISVDVQEVDEIEAVFGSNGIIVRYLADDEETFSKRD